ncbi:MAG TPA: hypothetical protein VF469_15890 [Kofleriaceae bacterium]
MSSSSSSVSITVGAREHVDAQRYPAHHRDVIRLGEPPPISCDLLEAKFSDRRGHAPCVCRRRIDQNVEILCEARPAVRGQRVRADEQEPDAMALQCVQKLVPFG